MTCSLRSSALFNHVALIRKLWIAVAIQSNEQGNHPIELRYCLILQVICGILNVRLAPKA